MPKVIRVLPLMAVISLLVACDSSNQQVDQGIDAHPLADLQAGIWIDPNGCDHWIIDDGIEGYLSQRLDRTGKPVCSGIGPENTVVDDYKGGSPIPDELF